MTTTQRQQALVSLLLGTFPNFQSGDAEAALAAYDIVLSKADPRDVEPAIMMLIEGRLPGFDGRFAPTATQLSRAIRVCLEKRVDAEIAARKALPPPPDDWVDDPPEVKARNKARLDKLCADLAAQLQTDDAADEKRKREITNRANAAFRPSDDPYAVKRRLWDAGCPESDENAA